MHTYDNYIGGEHEISQEQGAISLVRRQNRTHAFLVVEYVDDKDEQQVYKIDFVLKEGSQDKANITCEAMSLDDLCNLGTECYSTTWELSTIKREMLDEHVANEKARADRDEIDYQRVGDSPIAGSLGSSMTKALSPDRKEMQKGSSRSCDPLVWKGHNCYSWAVAALRSICITNIPEESVTKFIFKDPRKQLTSTINGDTYKHRCLLM